MEKIRQNMIKQLIQGCAECKRLQAVWLQEPGDNGALGRVGGLGDKAGEEGGARHADHVKDSEQECANSRKLRRGLAGSRLHFSKLPSSVLWRTDHVGPVWIQGDLCG